MAICSNNTVHYTDKDGVTRVILHKTEVVKFTRLDGRLVVTLDSGGYQTVTTKSRMNQASDHYCLGFSVYQEKGKWYVRKHDGVVFRFKDGMAFEPLRKGDGLVLIHQLETGKHDLIALPMKTFHVEGLGTPAGGCNAAHKERFCFTVDAKSKEMARLAAYRTHEHIVSLRVTQVLSKTGHAPQ